MKEEKVVMMPKAWPLYSSDKSNLRGRVLGEVEKNSFITLLSKGRHSGLCPSKTVCSKLGEFGEEFYSNG